MQRQVRRPSTTRTLCVAFVFCAGFVGGKVGAEPYIPFHDDVVLEKLPTPGKEALRTLQKLRAQLNKDRENLRLALSLARRYMDLGRAEADPRYYGYAEAALRPWWDLDEPPVEVLVLRAGLHQSRHDFDTALEDLARVLKAQPDHAQALLTRAFVLQVKGRNGEALQSCRRLPKNLHPLITATCVGRVMSLTGQAAQGQDRLKQSIAAEANDDRLRLWALTNLGEIAARIGDNEEAERRFRAALDLGRRDVYLLGAYADLLLEQDRVEEARALLDGETRIDALLLRLAIAEDRLGRDTANEYRAMLEARFDASNRRGSTLHQREEARFHLEVLRQPESALRLAEANWAVQKEPQDTALVLQAALAAGAPERAGPVLKWVTETGLEDVSIRALIRQLDKG